MSFALRDVEIIQKVVEHDSKALEVLYDKYSPILFTLVNKIVGNKEKAGIILSDIFVIVWQKSNLFNSETQNLFTWLILLSRNKSLDLVRRESGQDVPEYSDEYENSNIIPAVSKSILPLDIEDAFEKRELIFSSIGKLTEAQLYVLSLAFYQGLSEPEIANKLNIPLPTIKSKLRVVLNSLKQSILEETL